MIMLLPPEPQATVDYAFPNHLDLDYVRHSEECYTVVLMDPYYKHYTFRLNLSLDGRWTLAPISGFEDTADLNLY